MYKLIKQNIILIALLVWSLQGFAQNLDIKISPVFGNEPITEERWFVSANGDSVQFDNVRFYISNIQFDLENGQTFKDALPAHLIDVFERSTLNISLQSIDYKHIRTMRFNIGIDSTTSISGALGGDLDPQKGMYWAWQSGYINMKIEGRSPQCPNRKNVFQFHIGGYMQPFYAMRQVELPVKPFFTEEVVLKVDVSNFFKNINIAGQNSIMRPCKDAVQLADLSIQMFSIY
jgi:hypothetical protein